MDTGLDAWPVSQDLDTAAPEITLVDAIVTLEETAIDDTAPDAADGLTLDLIRVADGNDVDIKEHELAGVDSVVIPELPTLTWEAAITLPAVRVGTVVGQNAGQVMIASGEGLDGELTADVQLLNTSNEIWGTGAAFAPIRRYAAGAVLDAQLYIALGLAPNNQGMGSVVRYNPAQNAWKVLLANPNPGCCAGAASANGKVWLLGGRLGSTLVESFSPAQGVWLAHQPMPVGTSFPAVTVNSNESEIYVIGGTTADTPDGGTTHATVQRYSIATDSWTTLADLPEPRAAASAIFYNNYVWVLGGESASTPAQASIFVYAPNEDSWSVAAPLPNARSRHGSTVVGTTLYVLGGFDAMGNALVPVDMANISTI